MSPTCLFRKLPCAFLVKIGFSEPLGMSSYVMRGKGLRHPAGPHCCSVEHEDQPGLHGLLIERERAWLLAAKLVDYWRQLEYLMARAYHACK